MAYSVSTKPAVDGTGAAIPGGVVFVDESGLGSGPYIIGKTTIDPAGVNAQLVLANGAAKSDLSSVNGINLGSPSAYGTAPGAVNVPGVNAFITNTVGISGTVTANAGTGTFTVAGTVAATQSGAWTVQQGTPPWSVSQSGAWTVTANQGSPPWAVSGTVTANAGTGTFTVGGTVAATQSGTWTVAQGSPPWTIQGDSASAASNAGNPVKIGGAFNTTQPTVLTGQTVDAQMTARGAQIVATGVDAFTVAQGGAPWSVSQSGTWTVGQGTPPWSVSQSGAWTVTANAGTGTFTVGGTVTANQGGAPWSQNQTQLNSVALGSPSNYGTSPGAVAVAGVNAFVTNTVAVSGTVTANAGTGTFAVSGTVTANQGGAPWSNNQTQINGSAVVTAATGVQKVGVVGNAGGAFDAASGATAPANVLNAGNVAMTTLPTAVSAGQMVGMASDKFGRVVAIPQTTRDNIGTQTTTISTTTETTIVTAGGAGVFDDLMMLIVSNTAASGSDTRIDFRDTTAGTVLFSLMSRGGQQPIGFAIGGVAIPQTGANTNWTAQLATAVTDIRVYAVFAKNK